MYSADPTTPAALDALEEPLKTFVPAALPPVVFVVVFSVVSALAATVEFPLFFLILFSVTII